MRFSFGQNWRHFSTLLDEQRLAEAEQSLQQLLACTTLEGRSFVDIGAGSGLFSVAAARLGATPVMAVDRDAQCVATIRANVERFLDSTQSRLFQVHEGDILRADALSGLGGDVVYAWGSLHHTGSMWQAIQNAANLCHPGGQFVVAIYNRTRLSRFWLAMKRLYAGSPLVIGLILVAGLSGTRSAVRLLSGRHPFRVERGMSVWYDAVDWLGGLPYECATADELIAYVERLGFRLERSALTQRSGCNEFTFLKHQCAVSQAS